MTRRVVGGDQKCDEYKYAIGVFITRRPWPTEKPIESDIARMRFGTRVICISGISPRTLPKPRIINAVSALSKVTVA
jgi:hypothetical protein